MKRKILKFIARFTVFFRFTIARECRVSVIQYRMQKLTNVYSEIDTFTKP